MHHFLIDLPAALHRRSSRQSSPFASAKFLQVIRLSLCSIMVPPCHFLFDSNALLAPSCFVPSVTLSLKTWLVFLCWRSFLDPSSCSVVSTALVGSSCKLLSEVTNINFVAESFLFLRPALHSLQSHFLNCCRCRCHRYQE